ncbi:hypothetical protein FJT64_027381 [Amphibalanus amphitrite]|uniref:Uncharacterized protein n=1 Tax=Amphibalanus amphitrite TaxID=1232801 RepID=A0A6A4W8C8_AMPAM|nr:hypothetical protein FJT64_027381 [Amphibalanus amphitrite]
MKRPPALVLVLLLVTTGRWGAVHGQSREELGRPPVVRPPAIPRGAAPRPLVRAPAPPVRQGAGAEPQPPAPPPTTDRACVVRHVGGGEFKKECVDIAERCARRQCPPGTVCALNLDEELECFPESVKKFQSCLPDFLRLSQPCPADSGIRAFGMGCNYCVGGNPFQPLPIPSPPRRRLDTSGQARQVVSPPAAPPAAVSSRACVVTVSDQGESVGECVDISGRCARRGCPAGTVCALDLESAITCLPGSLTEIKNCGSESARLRRPCPFDTGITGFGMGCTFCVGGNPFLRGPDPPALSATAGRQADGEDSTEPPSPPAGRACPVLHVRDGEFSSECTDISEQCARQSCAPDQVCGLTHAGAISCFPRSVTEFQHCGSERSRLEQPCPADAGIRGFGMGCTFCVGGNPFTSPSVNRRRLNGTTQGPAEEEVACVVRHISSGNFKRECRSIRAECDQKQCPVDTVCGLDLDENITCFDASVKEFENCGPESFRLQQPCPADAGIRGFGMGCTFCRGGRPFFGRPTPTPVGPPTPTPTAGATGSGPSSADRVACVSRITAAGAVRRGCMDISELCQRRRCPADRTCALDINEQPSCFAASQLPISNCGTTRQRVAQPCPADTAVVAFGAGCTYCRPPAGAPPPPPPPGAPRRACVVSGPTRRCEAIEARCAELACAETCALALDGQARCFAASELPAAHCGPERRRLDQPCPAGQTAVAFGAGCTFCRPQ